MWSHKTALKCIQDVFQRDFNSSALTSMSWPVKVHRTAPRVSLKPTEPARSSKHNALVRAAGVAAVLVALPAWAANPSLNQDVQNNGNVLAATIAKQPLIASINFSGVSEFDPEALNTIMREAGIEVGRIFDEAFLVRAEQLLKQRYVERSRYAVQIVPTMTSNEQNGVHLDFKINEGGIARIKDLRISGNKAFPESVLREQMAMDASGWMSWYTKADRYSDANLSASLEGLQSFYRAQGYPDFTVATPDIAMSPDKQKVSITIKVNEGNHFSVSAIHLGGNYLGKEKEFLSLVSIRPGENYNTNKITQTVKTFTEYFGSLGYAFARVEAIPQLDRNKGMALVSIVAQPSERVLVRRITFEGNSRTSDELIRREMRQTESTWYNISHIRQSRERINRLGYFTNVVIETVPVPDARNQVDLKVTVEEQTTGYLSFGAGYSQAEEISFNASLKQDNVLGSGHRLSLNLNASKYNRHFVLSTTNPYFTHGGISRTYDLYYRATRPYGAQGGDYEIAIPGVGVRFGVPVTERDVLYFGVAAEHVKLKEGNGLPEAFRDQNGSFLPATIGWLRDNRDSALAPMSGRLQKINVEYGLGGAHRYAKYTYQFQQYVPISRRYTFAFNTELGAGKGLGGQPFPALRNFQGGGLGSVRGFEQGTLGPTSKIIGSETEETVNVGGAKSIVLNAEFIAPFPGADNDRSLRWFAFIDVGNVYGEFESVNSSRLRSSAGIGLNWISPIGPLRFALSNPLRKFEGDKPQKFQFQVGTSF